MSSTAGKFAKAESLAEIYPVLSISLPSTTPTSSTLPEAPSLHAQSVWGAPKIYLSWAQNIRRLCFFAFLGGMCAFGLISQLCAPYSSSYCTSVARWLSFSPFRASQMSQGSCILRGGCLDSDIAARTIHLHLKHAHYMASLIEGTGLPPMHFFNSTPVGRNFADHGLSYYINDDPNRKRLIEDLPQLFRLRGLIHRRYHPYLIKHFYTHFDTKPTRAMHKGFRAAISGLSAAIEREKQLSTTSQQWRIIEIDKILQKTLDRLFRRLQNMFRQLAADTPPFLEHISAFHALSQRISSELESEIARVEMAYHKIPWWDSYPFVCMFAHGILGMKPQRRMFTKYHEFLSADASDIRYIVEQVAILHDHLEILQRYFLWYSDGPIIMDDVDDAPVPTPAELFKLEDELVERLHAGYWAREYDSFPPHRLTATYPSLPLNPDHPSSPSQ